MSKFTKNKSLVIFLVFALGYFISTLIRAITATISPVLTQTFELSSGQLGLLAGAYFVGFAAMQLPLGAALDKHGAKRTLLFFLSLAVLGCIGFAMAQGFVPLFLARILTGIGVCACLMAPLTAYRRWFAADIQLRANSWMLMTGSLGMLASTLPIQWLLPVTGWRWIFVLLALLVVLEMLLLVIFIPSWAVNQVLQDENALKTQQNQEKNNEIVENKAVLSDIANKEQSAKQAAVHSSRIIWQHPYFWRMVPLGMICYGGLMAIQTLWANPFMVRVANFTPQRAAQGLFILNVWMMITFFAWGWLGKKLNQMGWDTNRLVTWGLPVSFGVMVMFLILGRSAYESSVFWLTLYCVTSTFVTIIQPTLAQVFPSQVAGRALTAYNLVLFLGVFLVQYTIGLLIDLALSKGQTQAQAFSFALGVHLTASVCAYGYFVWAGVKSNKEQ